MAAAGDKVLFGDRLTTNRYYNMEQVAAQALMTFRRNFAG